jgi:NAD(P)-dependent dehydrogenase (short-subunit alcohol dehydrogenase family)
MRGTGPSRPADWGKVHQELKRRRAAGVGCWGILPGWIDTEMTEGLQANDKFMGNVVPRIPMRRFGKPSDFGGIAVYLMSAASAYHTGDCIVIDDGYSAF